MDEKFNENEIEFSSAQDKPPVPEDRDNTLQHNNENDKSYNESNVSYEQNDNWEFEAKAETLDETMVESDEFEIKIPEKKTDVQPKPEKEKKMDSAPPVRKKKDAANTTKFVLAGITSALIIAVLVFLGVRYYTVPNSEEQMNPGNIAVTVNDTDVSIGMYNYYYTCITQNYISYAQYGYYEDLNPSKDYSKQTTTDEEGNTMKWSERFRKDTLDQIKYITSYYEAAVNAGVTLTAEQKENVEENLKTIKESAREADMPVNEYISATYGEHCGYATLKKMLEQCYIAETYYYQNMVETKATDDEIKDYYKKHKTDYLNVDFAYLQMSYTDSNKSKMIKKAEKYARSINSVESLKKNLPAACSDLIKQYVEAGYYENEEACAKALAESVETTISKSETGFIDEALDWLFSDDTAINDCKYFDDTENSIIYILLKTGKPAVNKEEVYSVRHILVMPESKSDDKGNTDDESENPADKKYTDEEWAAAKAKADKILKQFNSGDKTEYSFAKLAEKYSGDTESTSSGSSGIYGGLYAGTTLGTMVKNFEDWSVDDSRKYGDTAIVKSDYGYHIMFFIGDYEKYIYDCAAAVATEKQESVNKNAKLTERSGMSKTKVAKPQAQKADTADGATGSTGDTDTSAQVQTEESTGSDADNSETTAKDEDADKDSEKTKE